MSVATPRAPLSTRATVPWTTGSAAPSLAMPMAGSSATITAVATAPARVPNHKRARSPDAEHVEDSEHKRSRGSANTTADAAANDARIQRQREREHYRTSYLKAFPSFVFYFDTNIEESLKNRQSKIIHSLGGRVDPFFSRKVTHVITSCPRARIDALAREAASNKENDPKKHEEALRSPAKTVAAPSTSRSKPSGTFDSALLVKAIGYGAKIWEAIKLNNILDSITYSNRQARSATPSAQPTLEHLLASERIHGTHERDPNARRADYTYFPPNSYVLLVEDLTGTHATIAHRDFGTKPVGGARPGYPICHAHPDTRGPFCEPPKEVKRGRGRERGEGGGGGGGLRRAASMSHMRRATIGGVARDPEHEQEVDEELEADLEPDRAEYVAASGNSVAITSNVASTTSTAVAAPGVPRVRSTLRFQALAKGAGGGGAMPPPRVIRKAKSTNSIAVRLPVREERKKPGYCENCRTRFEDFDQHVKGNKHRKFATKDSNFRELDLLLERVARRPIQPVEVYDHEDEDAEGELEEDVGDSSEDYGELLPPVLGGFMVQDDDHFAGRRHPVMINGKGIIATDSDVVVIEPGDTQEEEDIEL
ncbi:regulatory subunit for Cdc7p protein kinase [Ceratobasidium sp. AG-Ba]|nr:regulatory subunit for Cdc7p protein kinase [Ceratobasidium sp. AG-Ba]QRW08210.1 regulatory subunit for Cdc7p protein kinase [Ceratobasidium sp. AG-Ba]